MHRALLLVSAVLCASGGQTQPAAEPVGCAPRDLGCLHEQFVSECARSESTVPTCLVFLSRLETIRRASYSTDVALLLGETLHSLAEKEVPPEMKERLLERARAAYGQVVEREPFNASGYLGLAEVAATGEEQVEWLRGAVRAEYRPAHMELLASALSREIGGHVGDLEAAGVLEYAYTLETTDAERWRYGVSVWRRYADALERYPAAISERAVTNAVLRVEDDIDYPLLQRLLLQPTSDLTHLADAFATLCEKSIAAIISLDECMAGLETAVATAEVTAAAGSRRLLAEAALTGMRTVAGDSLPRSAEALSKFPDWLDRLLMTGLEPVEVAANLLEARADYTADLLKRTDTLLAAIELSPTRGDLRLKLGATYVRLELWLEALEALRVAAILLPPEEHERVAELVETADNAYQARFLPIETTP